MDKLTAARLEQILPHYLARWRKIVTVTIFSRFSRRCSSKSAIFGKISSRKGQYFTATAKDLLHNNIPAHFLTFRLQTILRDSA